MGNGAMAPKAKKKDKEDNEVLTRIAIVSSDRYVDLSITALRSSCEAEALTALFHAICWQCMMHDA